ncbi:MAG: hypothetical protein Q9160_003515 [Pyrenula sp. 1 TL-2023]
MLIQEPTLLARLPSSMIETDQAENVRFSQVYGIQGSRKRKRFEVAAAINGEAILIYNAGGSIRRTVCAFKRSEQELHSYYDSLAEPIPSTHGTELRDSKSPIVHLEWVPCQAQTDSSDEKIDILAIHEDGCVEVFSGDLQTKRSRMSINGSTHNQAATVTVTTAALLSFDDARRTIFRGRDDLVTQLTTFSADARVEYSVLLVVVAMQPASESSSKRYQIRILAVPHSNQTTSIALHQSEISELVNYDLPQSEELFDGSNLRFDLRSAPGTLLVRSGSTFTTYDSLAFAPRIVSKVALSSSESSLQYLSSHLLAEASTSGLTIFDTKYRTTQAMLDTTNILEMIRKKKVARKGGMSLRLVSYFPKLGSLLALIGQSLVSFELSQSPSRRGVPRERNISLLDAMDQGTNQESFGLEPSQMQKMAGFGQTYGNNGSGRDEVWISDCLQMDTFLKDNNVEAFEEALSSHLNKDQSGESGTGQIEGLTLPSNVANVDKLKIDFLLKKIFDIESLESTSEIDAVNLRIKFLPPRLVQWLIASNLFTSTYIQRTLAGVGRRTLVNFRISRILIQCDPTVQWLRTYLQDSPTIDLPDLIWVLKLLVADAVADFQNPSTPTKLLTDVERPAQSGGPGEAMDVDREVNILSALPAGTDQHSQVSILEEAKTGAETEALRLALNRLEGYDNNSKTSAMGSALAQEEIVALIQFLRHELFMAGHTSHFRHQVFESSAYQGPVGLGTIVQILACCINALGPISFVDSGDNEGFFEKLISDLREEISAALAGIEEAMYAQGLIREILRFGTSAIKYKSQEHSGLAIPSSSGKVGRQKAGTIVTIYSEPTDEKGDPDATLGMLPLNLQADDMVSNTKKRKGGGQISKRTNREKAYLRSRREVGKYSFDRLVL